MNTSVAVSVDKCCCVDVCVEGQRCGFIDSSFSSTTIPSLCLQWKSTVSDMSVVSFISLTNIPPFATLLFPNWSLFRHALVSCYYRRIFCSTVTMQSVFFFLGVCCSTFFLLCNFSLSWLKMTSQFSPSHKIEKWVVQGWRILLFHHPLLYFNPWLTFVRNVNYFCGYFQLTVLWFSWSDLICHLFQSSIFEYMQINSLFLLFL